MSGDANVQHISHGTQHPEVLQNPGAPGLRRALCASRCCLKSTASPNPMGLC